jgi:hypothetical protein
VPFVNNYGVWVDEFRELGLENTLELSFPDALCYFGEGQEVRAGEQEVGVKAGRHDGAPVAPSSMQSF